MGGATASATSTFLLETRQCVVAVRGGLLVQLWRESPTEEGATLVRRAVQEANDQFQIVMVLVEAFAATPKPESRVPLNELSKLIAPRPTAVVYENGGFGAAAVRGTSMAISAASGGTAVIRMMPSIEQAVQWLESQDHAPVLVGVDAFIAEMRRPVGMK
jgi:hypothetical protein